MEESREQLIVERLKEETTSCLRPYLGVTGSASTEEITRRVRECMKSHLPAANHAVSVRELTWCDLYPGRVRRMVARVLDWVHGVCGWSREIKRVRWCHYLFPYSHEYSVSDYAGVDTDTGSYSSPPVHQRCFLNTPTWKLKVDVAVHPVKPVEYIHINLRKEVRND